MDIERRQTNLGMNGNLESFEKLIERQTAKYPHLQTISILTKILQLGFLMITLLGTWKKKGTLPPLHLNHGLSK